MYIAQALKDIEFNTFGSDTLQVLYFQDCASLDEEYFGKVFQKYYAQYKSTSSVTYYIS